VAGIGTVSSTLRLVVQKKTMRSSNACFSKTADKGKSRRKSV
jgi:hypothetical protein